MAAKTNSELIKEGFKINEVSIGNPSIGKQLWSCSNPNELIGTAASETIAKIPKEVLQQSMISRDINFSSKETINNLNLKQEILLNDQVIEYMNFKFGFVIPESTNNWQQIIETAGQEQMIPVSILSGNLVVRTEFYDGNNLISTSNVRIFYI